MFIGGGGSERAAGIHPVKMWLLEELPQGGSVAFRSESSFQHSIVTKMSLPIFPTPFSPADQPCDKPEGRSSNSHETSKSYGRLWCFLGKFSKICILILMDGWINFLWNLYFSFIKKKNSKLILYDIMIFMRVNINFNVYKRCYQFFSF